MQVQINIDFSAATHARRTDPETSKQAAARVREFASGQCAEILVLLRRYGAMTPEMIAAKMGIDAYAVRKRLPELERSGMARPNGMTAPTISGRSQRVWEAV